MYENMAKDISKQSKRLGGKMAVAHKLDVRDQIINSVARSGFFLTKMENFKPLKKILLLLSVRKWSLS